MKTVYSNNDYIKLGDRIRKDTSNISEHDLEILQQLRVSYKEPLSIIFNNIEKLAHAVDPHCVCTYRIKRIESIISKLIRFPKMHINRAEDIAGCRCILSEEKQVYELYNRILKKKDQINIEIKGKVNDYIETPKESGYKSIHLNVVLKGDNKRIEIQLRSIEHHNWATLVEITDLLYGLKLKEIGAKSNPELFRFHYLLSKPQNSIKIQEVNEIVNIVIKNNYIQKLGDVFVQNLDVRQQWNSLKSKKDQFFLIATGMDGVPEIMAFKNFDDAESAYFEKFINNKSNKNIVLTHLKQTNFAKISAAYSNYFLTFNNTMVKILMYLSIAVEESYKKNKIRAFKKYYQAFLDIMLFWMNKQIVEIELYNHDNNGRKYTLKYKEWGATIKYGIQNFNKMFSITNSKLRFRLKNFIVYYIAQSKRKAFETRANTIIQRKSNS